MNKNTVSMPKIFKGLIVTIIINIIWGLLTYNLFFNSKIKPFELTTWTKGIDWAFLILVGVLELIFLKLLIKDNRIIVIKNDEIIFKSWVIPIYYKIRKKTFYDGYILVGEKDKYGNVYQAMYLIGKGKIIDKISSFYYQNFDDIVDAFDLKFLGRPKVGFIKQLLVNLEISVRY